MRSAGCPNSRRCSRKRSRCLRGSHRSQGVLGANRQCVARVGRSLDGHRQLQASLAHRDAASGMHPTADVGLQHFRLGDALASARRYAEAEKGLREANRIFAATLSPDHADVRVAAAMTGQVLARTGPRRSRCRCPAYPSGNTLEAASIRGASVPCAARKAGLRKRSNCRNRRRTSSPGKRFPARTCERSLSLEKRNSTLADSQRVSRRNGHCAHPRNKPDLRLPLDRSLRSVSTRRSGNDE